MYVVTLDDLVLVLLRKDGADGVGLHTAHITADRGGCPAIVQPDVFW